jgi:hypothetical protein
MRRMHTQGAQVIKSLGQGANQILRTIIFVVRRPGGECSMGTRNETDAKGRTGAARGVNCATHTQ